MKYSIYIWYIIIQVWANHPLFVGPPFRLPRHFGSSCTRGLRFVTTIITIIMIIIFIWYWRENCQIGEKIDVPAWLGIGNAQRNLIVPVILIVVSKPDYLSDLFRKRLNNKCLGFAEGITLELVLWCVLLSCDVLSLSSRHKLWHKCPWNCFDSHVISTLRRYQYNGCPKRSWALKNGVSDKFEKRLFE